MNNDSAINNCTIRYPFVRSDGKRGSQYGNNNLYICALAPVLGFPNGYLAWDVVGHEYGHHVQHCFNIANNPGGQHSIPGNVIDNQYNTTDSMGNRIYTLEESKDRGIRLAWGEGWPTFWSTVAQQSFPDDIKTISTVGDLEYTSYNGLSYGIDSYSHSWAHGEADECAITRILFKLFSLTKDEYDKFTIPDTTLWEIISSNHIKTFHAFISKLYDLGYDKFLLGKLLSQYKIAALNIEIINGNYLDECPTFQWDDSYGSNYLSFNEFDLVFANTQGQILLEKTNLYTNSYTLTKSEWSSIISCYGKIYYAYIISRQNFSFYTGSYYSEKVAFYQPDDFINKVQIKPEEWGFEPQYFFTTNKWKQTSTPITRNGLTITHDRLRCGYIENSYVILSPRRENAGTAYLTMEFDSPVYSYMFGITLWSSSEYLNSYDSTAVVEYMDENNTWHEDLNLMNDLPNGFSIRTQQIDRYEIAHVEGIYGLRFVVTSSAVGSKNKGRLCLDDIVLNTNQNDLWFISTFYE